MIGVVEGATEFGPQRFGPGITMRLEHREHAFPSRRARGCKRGADFGRMMSVIIDEKKTIALVLDLETAAGMAKCAQRPNDLREGNPQLGSQRDHPDGVADVV